MTLSETIKSHSFCLFRIAINLTRAVVGVNSRVGILRIFMSWHPKVSGVVKGSIHMDVLDWKIDAIAVILDGLRWADFNT